MKRPVPSNATLLDAPPAVGRWLPWAALAGALAAAYLWLGFGFIRSAAATYDEGVHLASGYSYLATGRYRLNVMDHPPLAEMWAALGIVPLKPHLFLQHPDWLDGRVFHYGDLFLNRNRVPADGLLNRARAFNFTTLSLLLALALAAWAWSAGGPWAAAGAAVAQAFSPAILSNLALVTTDGASAVLFFGACALAAGACRREDEGRGALAWWLGAGAASGLALASKFNMILLPPLLFGLASLSALTARPKRAPPAALWGMLAVAALALAAVYRFGQAGLWWDGLVATVRRLDEGRGSFFFGSRSVTGTLAYFPAALAVKTPIPALLLAALGLAHAARLPWRRSLWLWAPPAVYLAAAMTAKVQIGYRHVLPVVPFLLLWAGLGCVWLSERGAAARAALATLVAWLCVTVIRVHPHQLAYFNEAVGGPARGYECLVDSNLDWGQAVKPLAAELERLGNPPIYFAYFGTAEPAAYGIRYYPVGIVANVDRPGNHPDPAESGRALLAVSATNLQGAYYGDGKVFSWLLERRPVAVAGYSIFLYDLTRDADGRKRLAALLPPPNASSLLALK